MVIWGALPAARTDLGSFGLQTANVACGGTPSPSGSEQSTSYEYDGSSWTSGGTMNTAREFHGGSGTLTAGLICGGSDVPGTPKITRKSMMELLGLVVII